MHSSGRGLSCWAFLLTPIGARRIESPTCDNEVRAVRIESIHTGTHWSTVLCLIRRRQERPVLCRKSESIRRGNGDPWTPGRRSTPALRSDHPCLFQTAYILFFH